MKVELTRFSGGANGCLTLVSDDGILSSAYLMAPLLRERGLVCSLALIGRDFGTPVLSGESYTVTRDDQQAKNVRDFTSLFAAYPSLYRVASHAQSHASWGSDPVRQHLEVVGSQAVLRDAFPTQDVMGFVYPGYQSPTRAEEYEAVRPLISAHYLCARGLTSAKCNSSVSPDLLYLETDTLRGIDENPKMQEYALADVARAAKDGEWAMVMWHGVFPNGTNKYNQFHIYRDQFIAFLDEIARPVREGKLMCTFFDDAARYIAEREGAHLQVTESADRVTVTLTHSLDPSVYHLPLTVRITGIPLTEWRLSGASARRMPDGSILCDLTPSVPAVFTMP